MKNSTQKRVFQCPMCGGNHTVPKAEVEKFIYMECVECRLVFCPKITREYLQGLYVDGFHGIDEGAPKKGWKKDAAFLNPVFSFLPENRHLKVLDFGTGQDRIPDLLREKGHRVIAVDIVPPLRPHPDRLTGDILELNLDPGQFDLIYSFQVFEHLPNPRQITERLLELIKPEGLLLLHTDMETEERHRDGFSNWWYVMPPDHCTLYSHQTFERFAASTGNPVVWKDEKSIIMKKQVRQTLSKNIGAGAAQRQNKTA